MPEHPNAITVGEGGQGGKGNRNNPKNPGVGGNGANSTAFGATGAGGGGGGCSTPGQPTGYDLGQPGGCGGGAGGSAANKILPDLQQETWLVLVLHMEMRVDQKDSNSNNPGYFGGGGGGTSAVGGTGGTGPPDKGSGGQGYDAPLTYLMLVITELGSLEWMGWSPYSRNNEIWCWWIFNLAYNRTTIGPGGEGGGGSAAWDCEH